MFSEIRNWALDRNLVTGSTPSVQLNKLMEEVGELASGINKRNTEVVLDSIGDTIVVLTIMAAQYGIEVEKCIEMAYDTIKDRKGRMVGGMFIKEGD
jgi:NTP pyrophosphatase (non-canonical NTP hydrolase)